MEVDRRTLLTAGAAGGLVGAAAAPAYVTVASSAVRDELAVRLAVPRTSLDAALRRFDEADVAAGRVWLGNARGAVAPAGADDDAALSWRFDGPARVGLDRAVALVSGAGFGLEPMSLRAVASCTFGGLTLATYRTRRIRLGLLAPGDSGGHLPWLRVGASA